MRNSYCLLLYYMGLPLKRMHVLVKFNRSEMRYNNDMQKELEAKLAEIEIEIAELEFANSIAIEFAVGDEAIGRYYVLKEMKEWIEGLIANYCE